MGNYDAMTEKRAEQSEKDEWLFLLVDDWLKDEWTGTATELCTALKEIDPNADIAPNTITKKLKDNGLFKENNIIVKRDRDSKSRAITITRLPDEAEQTELPE